MTCPATISVTAFLTLSQLNEKGCVIQQHISRCHGAHTWVVRPTLPVFLRLPVPKIPSRETVTSTLTVKLSSRVQLTYSLRDWTETIRLNPQSISQGENVCIVSGCTRKRFTAPFAQSTQTAGKSCSGRAQEHKKLYGTAVPFVPPNAYYKRQDRMPTQTTCECWGLSIVPRC
jgi:hypothetical protein